ncbi:uncharacterized protein [Dermacentor albipictus]|uniref:uncharacterized protein n=1 Tax=Dermacentor albipictus TaxID=60249 RepID=UPI0038FC3C13
MNRWQRYLEESELYPNSIIGFRKKLGTQDTMILLKNEIIDDTTGTKGNRAILGLDLQSTFDKVRHSAILAQVSRLNMGRRTYQYIKDFLMERTTKICAGDLQLEEKKLGSVGTPQGSVISPLLFNHVMIGVANRLERVAGVRHTIYADDVTLCVPGGSDGHIETTLQEAVNATEKQLGGSGLVCSPAKSELLVIPPTGAGRKKKNMEVKYEQPKITVKTAGGQVIPEVEKIRVLGLLIQRNRVNGETVNKLAGKAAAAMRLIKRVSNRRAGMKEESLTRLVQSFAVSHITYVATFHNWRPSERNKIDATIRKAYKAALGLLGSMTTETFMALGVHNTLDEIAEAQRTAHLERLSEMIARRKILQDLGLEPRKGEQQKDVPIPDSINRKLRVCPIPINVNPEHKERRLARPRALVDLHAREEGAIYVDAAEYRESSDAYAVAAVGASTGATKTAASVRTRKAHWAEEVAIALAVFDPGCTTVLCDSRTAVKNYAKRRICSEATRILCKAEDIGRKSAVEIKWFPAHMGSDVSERGNVNHNETANSAARGLTNRAAASTADSECWSRCSVNDKVTTFNEIVKWYRLNRQAMPPPHPGLTRKEAVLYRQLQTVSLLTPVLAKHVCPIVYASDVCRLCAKERATAAHILWDCSINPRGASEKTTIPPQLEAATRSYDQDTQLKAVQQVSAALERLRPSKTEEKGGSTPRKGAAALSVYAAAQSFKKNPTPGPDEITNAILRNLSDETVRAFTQQLN